MAILVAVIAAAMLIRPIGPVTGADIEPVRLEHPVVLTQLPVDSQAERQGPLADGMLRADYGEGARLVLVLPDGAARVLSAGLHSACDPDVSADGRRILFAGKRTAEDPWNIFEIELAGDRPAVRQITEGIGDCRSPGYQSTLYTIISPQPWHQLTFVGTGAGNGTVNEFGTARATNLYSCKLDGSEVRRLTFNLSADMDPHLMGDGRLLFAAWQRRTLDRGVLGRIGLFGVGIDGTDLAAFCTEQGQRIKHMPCTTTGGLAVFVEADKLPWDGAGRLACVQLRRPLQTYRPLTKESDGLFHTPSGLPDGRILVSRRPADGSKSHGLWQFDLHSGKADLVFDDPRYHEIQAKSLAPRAEPNGRSSVVTEADPNGKLYCLNVYNSRHNPPGATPRVTHVRVLEGLPPDSGRNGLLPLVQRRLLGEVAVEADGSFHLEIPADIPIEVQTLDARGVMLKSCGWIWAKNHEPRGCIGCHEDGELTPDNRLMDALSRDAVSLALPEQQRQTVDFRRDVMPILERKCAKCHRSGKQFPHFDGGLRPADANEPFNRAYRNLLSPRVSDDWKETRSAYVQPGNAAASLIVGRIFAQATDATGATKPMPPAEAVLLTDAEKRTIARWIDMGALWDGIPGPDEFSRNQQE